VPLSLPPEPPPSESEEVVVDSEPPSVPELDPELPPSRPESVDIPPPPLPSCPSVDGLVTAVVSSEPSWPLPEEPPLEDVSS
jgi:hypothetical protein